MMNVDCLQYHGIVLHLDEAHFDLIFTFVNVIYPLALELPVCMTQLHIWLMSTSSNPVDLPRFFLSTPYQSFVIHELKILLFVLCTIFATWVTIFMPMTRMRSKEYFFLKDSRMLRLPLYSKRSS